MLCGQLGFRPPPADVHLRAMEVRGSWVVYVWSAEGQRDQLLAWLREHGDFEARGPGSMDRVLSVETDDLPPGWERLFDRFDVQSLVVGHDGVCVISLRGPRHHIRGFIDEIGDDIELQKMIEAPEGSDSLEEDPLTDTERHAVLTAYKAGYFEVPRDVRLSDLADELDKSTGGLSTLLRRGIQSLVVAYAREVLEEPAPPQEESTDGETPATARTQEGPVDEG